MQGVYFFFEPRGHSEYTANACDQNVLWHPSEQFRSVSFWLGEEVVVERPDVSFWVGRDEAG